MSYTIVAVSGGYTIYGDEFSTYFTEFKKCDCFVQLWREGVYLHNIYIPDLFYKAWREMKCSEVSSDD